MRTKTPRATVQPCRHACACALFVAIALLPGCGSEGPSLGIDELEQGRIQERLIEVDLGEFSVPISTSYVTEDKDVAHQTYMLLQFNLWALVTPNQQSQAKWVIERKEGALRDRVIKVCRRSPPGDLQDPNLTALRSRLLDQLQPLFDGHMLKRVGVNEVLTDPM